MLSEYAQSETETTSAWFARIVAAGAPSYIIWAVYELLQAEAFEGFPFMTKERLSIYYYYHLILHRRIATRSSSP